jgi:sugar lactone lactonase YvrE
MTMRDGRRAPRRLLILLVLLAMLGVAAGGSASWVRHPIWVARFNGPAGALDQANAVAYSPDGSRVYVTGSTGTSAGSDYATAAYDAETGSRLWGKPFAGALNANDSATAMVLSPDGTTLYVTGNVYTDTMFDFGTVAYQAATGRRLWTALWDDADHGTDYAASIAVSPDGTKVFVTGQNWGPGSFPIAYATVAYAAGTGAQLWQAAYDPGAGWDQPNALAVDPSGTLVFVTGESDAGTATGFDYATVAYAAATGHQQWVARFDGNQGSDEAFAIAVTHVAVFVTGFEYAGARLYDYATVAYVLSTGSRLWASTYSGPGFSSDQATAVVASPDESAVFVTGSSANGATGADYATVAYAAATGQQAWVGVLTGPGLHPDAPHAIGVSPDGTRVVVTGEIETGPNHTQTDYATATYRSDTGQRVWVGRYDGPSHGPDSARALAISPDGRRVVVTGVSANGADPGDIVTLAYRF